MPRLKKRGRQKGDAHGPVLLQWNGEEGKKDLHDDVRDLMDYPPGLP